MASKAKGEDAFHVRVFVYVYSWQTQRGPQLAPRRRWVDVCEISEPVDWRVSKRLVVIEQSRAHRKRRANVDSRT